MEMIAESFQLGGFWMYIILVVSIVALGIIIERFVMLIKYKVNGEAFMAQVQKLVMQNNIDRAIKLCNAAPDKVLARVVKAGLQRAQKSEIEITNAVEEATLEILPKVNKRLPNLPILANVATLMGLLGTIVGMIFAFKGLSAVSADKRQEVLSNGIAVAMYTTAFGLLVAIPTLLCHIVLTNMARGIVDEVDLYSAKLENLLIARLRSGAAAQSGEPRA
jgi:biopolymer transport protein ExbB/TolQ